MLRAVVIPLVGLVLFGSIILSLADEHEIIIIGNRTLPFDSLSNKDLFAIFMQRLTMWGDEDNINIALLKGGETHRRFLWTHFRKTPSQYRRYWKKMVFSGKGRTPLRFRTEKDLMAHVALTKGAIGYISSATKPGGVKVITIVD